MSNKQNSKETESVDEDEHIFPRDSPYASTCGAKGRDRSTMALDGDNFGSDRDQLEEAENEFGRLLDEGCERYFESEKRKSEDGDRQAECNCQCLEDDKETRDKKQAVRRGGL